ncbi:MAG: M23 family metallopeptidase [Desulfobacterales bacterium]|nr:MAG: M23 family metallopeptidase [Desulfobacterales bacterium]
MTARKSKLPKFLYVLMALLLCGLAIPLVQMIAMSFEGEMPTFQMEAPIYTIGRSYTLKGLASDQKSGLRRVWIAILQQGKERILFDQTFPSKGWLRRGLLQNQRVSLEINVEALGLSDGEALLRTAVWDYSYRSWWAGNRTYVEYKIQLDTQPPTIDVLSRVHNLNQGGAGLTVYQISEPGTVHGVQVADSFFPGYTGFFSDPNVYIAFFAIPYDQGLESELYVRATDAAGNSRQARFAYHINTRNFKKDRIRISHAFLSRKIPEFEGALNMASASALPIDKFVAVNQDLRRANHMTLEDACKKSDAKQYWEGAFIRLPHSARKAGFADHRKYEYNGKIVDEQVHLGIDLASTGYSPVPAGNNGRVALAEYLGIYGNTVLLDHGFGLFSMYGHLSRIEVAKDEVVSKGDVIGYTGMTGLAGGDHLHYSMIVDHIFVNPIEWWDPNWIKHNVTDKLQGIK